MHLRTVRYTFERSLDNTLDFSIQVCSVDDMLDLD